MEKRPIKIKVLLIAFLIALNPICSFSLKAESVNIAKEEIVTIDEDGYEAYIATFSDVDYGETINLTEKNVSLSSDNSKYKENICGSEISGRIIPDDGFCTWEFNVTKKSKYIVAVEYIPAEASSGNIELVFKLDGKIPFSEISLVSFPRLYEQSTKDFETNISGNDIKPPVSEIFVWREKEIVDSAGNINTPFNFVLDEGTHTLTLEGSRGALAVKRISLKPYDEPLTYEEYISECNLKGYVAPEVGTSKYEGEKFSYKSSVSILPQTDKSSPVTTPQSPSELKLNTVGGESWKTIGDSIVWKIDVEQSGMYQIVLRFMQDTKDGIFTSRKLYIDGKLPFKEASALRFSFSSKWQCEALGDGQIPYTFYFEKGSHEITLEVTSGDTAEITSTVRQALNELNRIYRRITMITGNDPDINRDYGFKNLIPNEIEEMKVIKNDLQKSVDYINAQAGTSGSYVSVIQKIIFQLEKMTDNPRNIAKYLERFKSYLGALGEWTFNSSEQPLEIDSIYIQSAGAEIPKADCGIFKKLLFSVRSFLYSYIIDYNSIGQTGSDIVADNKLKIWIQSGRDQGEIIRELIDTDFSEKHNASITLEVVSSGLLESVLAGISPDVVLDNGETVPVDYSLRNAVVDLTEFSDFQEVSKRFSAASLRPVSYNGSVYAIPQTFDFYMFFYRTDLFGEYGFSVPKTWTELYKMIPALQRNGLGVGIPHNLNMYTTLLYQNGGELYKNAGLETNLSSNISVKTFIDFCEIFTLYDCSVSYDFANRFRSGEMPCGIATYSQYNQLTAFAPEIKGLWEMVPIPGTIQSDGNINNISVGGGSYMMLMQSSCKKELAWEFMKWYMSSEIQSQYAIKMESVLGNCAKVNSANVEALSKMTWSSKEYKNLFSQLQNVGAVPQVPGGYYLSRIVDFAFNRVYNNSEDPSEVITSYVKELNEELERKHKEFEKED